MNLAKNGQTGSFVQIVDASVIAHALATEEELGIQSRRVIDRPTQLIIPECAYVEVLASLRKMWLRKDISLEVFRQALDDLVILDVHVVDTVELLGRAYELRHNVGAYDAMYVALAEVLKCPLITTDIRLSSATGVRCEIELLAA
jgi:predicted nucleic acid-binding protein